MSDIAVRWSSARLSSGRVGDEEFDLVYNVPWRRVSARYWTPVDVACRAAQWLTEGGAKTVLDIGAGVGKFCIVGASTTPASFVGVEHRYGLVAAARAAAQTLKVTERTMFIHAEASLQLMRGYSALYVFNPFGENLYAQTAQLDNHVELGKKRFWRDVSLVEDTLRLMPVGGRLVTYHGYGGRIPDNMDLKREEPIGSDVLRLWVKADRPSTGSHLETDAGILHVPSGQASRTDEAAYEVLFVDDDPTLLRAVERSLSGHGLVMTCASSGATALEMIIARADRYSVLITDLEMPGMSGLELAERVRKHAPHVRILLFSGAPAGTFEATDNVDAVLAKPTSMKELAMRVRALMKPEEPQFIG
ncbi:MAG: response regulator [Polyangiaceae bacterium]|nr:response regulator [Polyangiaceae bacterium]